MYKVYKIIYFQKFKIISEFNKNFKIELCFFTFITTTLKLIFKITFIMVSNSMTYNQTERKGTKY